MREKKWNEIKWIEQTTLCVCSACVYTLILTTIERETDRYWNEIFCMCTTLDCKVSKEKTKKLCNFNGVKTCPRNQKGAKNRFIQCWKSNGNGKNSRKSPFKTVNTKTSVALCLIAKYFPDASNIYVICIFVYIIVV